MSVLAAAGASLAGPMFAAGRGSITARMTSNADTPSQSNPKNRSPAARRRRLVDPALALAPQPGGHDMWVVGSTLAHKEGGCCNEQSIG